MCASTQGWINGGKDMAAPLGVDKQGGAGGFVYPEANHYGMVLYQIHPDKKNLTYHQITGTNAEKDFSTFSLDPKGFNIYVAINDNFYPDNDGSLEVWIRPHPPK